MIDTILDIDRIEKTFEKLTFIEEEHKYYVDGIPLDLSVSGVIKKFVEAVDFDSIALSIDSKKKLVPGTTSKIWSYNSKLSCAKGNKAHFFGEIYAFNRNISPTDKYEEAIVKFWADLPSHIIPVKVELEMYHKELMIGGMADIILFNTITGKYIIADYKTNKDLLKNYKGKKLLYPFNNLLDNPFNKYQLQFSFYQIMFEQTGLEVESRKLIFLKPDGEYELYNTIDLTNLIKDKLGW